MSIDTDERLEIDEDVTAEPGLREHQAQPSESRDTAADPVCVGDDISYAPGEAAEPADDEDTSIVGSPGGPSLRAAIEAVLLVVDAPVSPTMLAQVCERPQVEVEATLAELTAEYAEEGRGIALREVAGGWRFYTREECAVVVEKFVLDGQQTRLTQAALETLAVVAYRQPVSRSRVSAVRGVNVDGVMRTLLARGLVEEAGTEHESGATLYRTTNLFLERLGLNSLDELPALAPLLPDFTSLDGDLDLPTS
jgi:segregation and condensation protein B